MELVEIVLQGLHCAPEMARVPFSRGVTSLAATPAHRTIPRLMFDLLYPRGTEPTLTDLVLPAGQGRVALIVQGRDGHTYRLLLDVMSGRRALQKMVGDEVHGMGASAGEIAQAVTASVGFAAEDIMRELLCCAREDLPSQRPPRVRAAGGTGSERRLPQGFDDAPGQTGKFARPLPPGFSEEGGPAAGGARSDAKLRARLAEIDEALAVLKRIESLEFELDGLQKRTFELEVQLRPFVQLRSSFAEAEEQLGRYADVSQLPRDLFDTGEQLHKLRSDHQREMARLDDDRQQLLSGTTALDRRGRQGPLVVARRDRLVQAGVAVGMAAIVAGLVGALAWEPLRWAALLDIPAFGVALFGGLRVLSSLEEGESVRRLVERLDGERQRLEERFRADERHLEGALAAHRVTLEQLPALQDRVHARDEAVSLRTRTALELAAAEQKVPVAALEAERDGLAARIAALEEALQSSGSFSPAGDIKAEKAEIEALLSGAAPVDANASGIRRPEPLPVEPAEDLGQRLVQLAVDALMATLEDITGQVQARAGQILGALSDGRFREMRFGGRGETSVVAADGAAIPFGALPPLERDITWLALKIALIELVVRRDRMPVLFDRSLDFLADAKGPMLQKMLQFLGASTQVIFLSEKVAAPAATRATP